MIVCIAEKPSVGRDIARILGATSDRRTYMEGNGYQVTWTFGHLCCLKEPHDYYARWQRWSLSALPMFPAPFGIKVIEDEGIKRQFDTIVRLVTEATMVVNCGDAGQEGELIQRWVMQKAGVRCPVKRLWISSMTDEAIREGFAQLREEEELRPLYLAGLSRAVGDWLLGMNATRLYTLKYGRGGQVLSIGRVQTPTLALIVQRQREIEGFVPEPYWVLSTVYRKVLFTASRGKYASKEEGQEALAHIADKVLTITSVQHKRGSELPPHLFDLTSLQVECNKRFGFSAETTLNLIQGLYEKKICTYPRVDTQYLSDDIYPKCPEILNGLFRTQREGIAPYAVLIKPLGGKSLLKRKKVFDNSKVTDHHAIIPTGVPPTHLSDMEQRVFDLIARRFIAVFYPDCEIATTQVSAVIGKEGFKASGKEILSQGWRIVYAENMTETENVNGASEEKVLPKFEKGESGPHTPTLTEKTTTPPKPYTEATLLRAMETAGKFVEDEELRAALKENGIGRPSSRAGIIETLFKRHYIKRERKNLLPTPTGIQLIDTIREELLKSCELTGIWEKKLRDIERKQYNPSLFVEELKEQIKQIVHDVLSDNTPRNFTSEQEVQR